MVKNPCLLIQGQLSFQYLPCNFNFHIQVVGALMLSKTSSTNDPKRVEIKPIIGLETSAKFPISKLATLSSYWCMSSFKLNVSISAIFAYDCVHSKTNNFYNNLILKFVLGLIGDFHNNPTNTNDQTWEISRSLLILAPLTFIQLLHTTNNGNHNQCEKKQQQWFVIKSSWIVRCNSSLVHVWLTHKTYK